ALRAEALLQLGAPGFGVENLARLAIAAGRHQLERNAPLGSRIGGEEHGRHAAAADLGDDFIGADAVEDRVHHRLRRPGPFDGRAGGSCPPANQLSRTTRAAAASPSARKASAAIPWKTLPKKVG